MIFDSYSCDKIFIAASSQDEVDHDGDGNKKTYEASSPTERTPDASKQNMGVHLRIVIIIVVEREREETRYFKSGFVSVYRNGRILLAFLESS